MHVSLDSALGRQRRLNSVGESVLQIAPNAAAAYSLRSLTGGDPKVVRVRRGSDNHEQDFTASEVSSGALTSFVNAQVTPPLDIQELSATGRDGDFLIAKAAYSLRSLGTRQATLAATGDTVARANGKFVVQVRRSSDDALKSFTADEVTDGTLLAFVGTGGSDNGFVKTWYDQSVTNQAGDTATGNHAVQATAGSQPKIVNAGALVADNGIDLDGSQFLQADSVSGMGATVSMITASVHDSGGGGCVSLASSASSTTNFGIIEGSSVTNVNSRNTTSVTASASVSGATRLSFALTTGQTSTKSGALGGTLVESTSDYGDDFTSGELDKILIGKLRVSSGTLFNGRIREILVYTSDQTDNRGAIEANIGEAYSITGIPAYDDEVDGFVETWYDQSGNSKDAVQATAGSQPKIVNAGSLVTGGLRFDDAQKLETAGAFTFASGTTLSTFLTNKSDGDEAAYLFRFVSDYIVYNTAGGVRRVFAGTNANSGNLGSDEELWTTISALNSSGGTANFFADGTLVSSADANIGTKEVSNKVLNIGGSSSSNHWNGTVNEVIFYATDQTSNRVALESNIMTNYGIS